jgi:hypothetical protein
VLAGSYASTSRNLRGHAIDITLDSDSDEYDTDLDETDEEEDDLTGQPLNPPVRVTKQGGRTNRGAHDHIKSLDIFLLY